MITIYSKKITKIISLQDSYWNTLYRHSLSVTPRSDYLSLLVSLSLSLRLSLSPWLSLSVCPAIKAYVSVTMSLIFMKLGESVGT